jgi:hypothetical protein
MSMYLMDFDAFNKESLTASFILMLGDVVEASPKR